MSAKKTAERYLKTFLDFFEEDGPDEPAYDPVHLGGAVLISLSAIGALYWLLWTLLVYQGGIFGKVHALFRLATGTPLRELGWEGYPYQMGAFEGSLANVVALLLAAVAVRWIHRLFR